MKTTNYNLPASTRSKQSRVKLITIYIGVIVAAIILSTDLVKAQNVDTLKTSNVQVSLAYPLASNGKESMNFTNKYSLNIFYGVNGGVDVAEIGGFVNFNKGNVNGLQMSGFSNITNGSSNGLIVSGFLNYSTKSSKGVQMSIANVVKGDFTGVQLGIYNKSRQLKGVQFGLINIVDSVDNGVPVGLINIVKNGGYFAFEVTGGDALYANFNYKMGIEKFYTIFKLGYSTFNEKDVYSYGFGFGTNLSIAPKHAVSIDYSTSTIVYDGNWEESRKNLLSKVDFNYKLALTDKLSIIAGPSFNVYRSEVKVNDSFGTLEIPYTLYTNENADRKVSMWIGFNAGMSFKL